MPFNGTAAREPRKLKQLAGERFRIALQWDRGSRAAEARSGRYSLWMKVGLQWDRGSRAAEARVPGGRHQHAARPSMGPRLASRGSDEYLDYTDGQRTFNGTAAREPRKQLAWHVWIVARRPSMGPRLASRGSECMGRNMCGVAPFNGTAAREPRKQIRD